MKRNRLIIWITSAVIILTGINAYFLKQLYDDVKKQTIQNVVKCLERADIQEMIKRTETFEVLTSDTIQLYMPLVIRKDYKSRSVPAFDDLSDKMFIDSTGYFNITDQFMYVLSKGMHKELDLTGIDTNYRILDSIFRQELAVENMYPKVIIIKSDTAAAPESRNLWKIELPRDRHVNYIAYISPLTKHILNQMTGLCISIVVTFLIIGFALYYLFNKINKMRKIEDMKEDFVNNMTHELKTPIAIAYSANDALLNYIDPTDQEKRRTYLEAAMTQLDKLRALVEKILSMSMERRRTLQLHPQEIPLLSFLNDAATTLRLRCNKPLEIQIEVHPANLTINADPEYFFGIIDNLLDNAVKYSYSTAYITITATADYLSVSDRGIGIAGSHLPLIWERFWRVPQGNKRNNQGYGIGLYFVKSIVEKSGWHIDVNSKPGKGTTFTIKFA